MSCFLWDDLTGVDHLKLECLALIQVIQFCVCLLAMCLQLCVCVCVCVCAKVLVSYRWPDPGGSDPEEGAGAAADKLLGKDSTTYFQLYLVPEESVHGAGQLLSGSCEYKDATYYLQLRRYTSSVLTAPLYACVCVCVCVCVCLYVCVCVCRSTSTPECRGMAVSRE